MLCLSPISAALRRLALTALCVAGAGCVADFPRTTTILPVTDIGGRDSLPPPPDAQPIDAMPDAAPDLGVAAEVCNGADDDADGETDEEVPLRACPLQAGVCAASRRPCLGASGYGTCDYAAALPPFEADERLCDQADNDCDGTVDEGCQCMPGDVRDCGSDVGACTMGRQLCVEGLFGPCQGAIEPAAETCDGFDTDCDGVVDNLPPEDCVTGRPGRCEKGRPVCEAGEEICVTVEAPAAFDRCDGVDEDCDGAIDEDALRDPCDTEMLGVCGEGQLLCVGGRPRCTVARMPEPEVADGLDNDCDGQVDEIPPRRIDLADLAVGGDGSLPGQRPQDIRLAAALAAGGFQRSNSPMLDGAFSPSAQGLTPIDRAGSTFDFSPEVGEPRVAEPLAKGPMPPWVPLDGRPNYGAPDHSIIELPPNTGLTFDLGAIRDAQGDTPLRLTLRFGSRSPTPIIGMVLVDGVRHASAAVGMDVEVPLRVALNAQAQTLSIVIVAPGMSDFDTVRTYVGDPTLEFGPAN